MTTLPPLSNLDITPRGADSDRVSAIGQLLEGALDGIQRLTNRRLLAALPLMLTLGCSTGDSTDRDDTGVGQSDSSQSDDAWDHGDPNDVDGNGDLDNDDDGLGDGVEEAIGTDMNNADSDGDGYSDYEEHTEYDTDPLDPSDYPGHESGGTDTDGGTDSGENPEENPDTDQDGVPDANDLCPGTDSTATVDSDGCSDEQLDTDGDGMNDAWEAAHSLSDPAADADGDGLRNLTEYEHGMNPRGADTETYHDTDNDGAYDVAYGGTNVALNQPVSTLVETPAGNEAYATPASNLVDGDLSSQAYPANSEFGYCVEFGTPQTLSATTLEWGTYGTTWDPITSWTLSAITADDEVWTLSEGGLPGAERTLVAMGAGADTVAIQALCIEGGNSDGAWTGLKELSAY